MSTNYHMTNGSNKQQDQKKYDFFAFISYSSKDKAWGKRIQKKLESYRMPVTLCSEHGWERKPMKPVFFDKTDIQPGNLNAELQARLKASRNLIVICSPNSAKSKYVGDEIAYFHSLGRTDNIHFFIIDGEPHSGDEETECFNPAIERLGIPEILGANIHERVSPWPWINKERAFVQLITKLLGVEFDSIWQRHKRMMMRKAAAWCVGIIAVIAALMGVWKANQSFSLEGCLIEASTPNANLPQMGKAELTLFLDNEVKHENISQFGETFVISNIPAQFHHKKMRVKVESAGYLPLDTMVFMDDPIRLPLRRDDTFAKYNGYIFDENSNPLPGVQVQIIDLKTVTDENGYYYINIPIEKQRKVHDMKLSKDGFSDTVKKYNMQPGKNDFILYK